MAMNSSDLFMLRRGLVDAGMKDEVAEKVAIAMEGALALTIDQVLEKWSTKVESDMQKLSIKVEHDIEVVKKDMTIRLGLMLAGTVGLILTGVKLFLG